MTYKELSQIKTPSMTVNCIIDDVVANGRFCYTKRAFAKAEVPSHEINKIQQWAEREGVVFPSAQAA